MFDCDEVGKLCQVVDVYSIGIYRSRTPRKRLGQTTIRRFEPAGFTDRRSNEHALFDIARMENHEGPCVDNSRQSDHSHWCYVCLFDVVVFFFIHACEEMKVSSSMKTSDVIPRMPM